MDPKSKTLTGSAVMFSVVRSQIKSSKRKNFTMNSKTEFHLRPLWSCQVTLSCAMINDPPLLLAKCMLHKCNYHIYIIHVYIYSLSLYKIYIYHIVYIHIIISNMIEYVVNNTQSNVPLLSYRIAVKIPHHHSLAKD